MIVIGGGPLGLEFAQMFAHFGTRVTVRQRWTRYCPGTSRKSPPSSRGASSSLRKEGSLAAENALTGSRKSIDYDHVPHAVFANPKVANVGLTEEEEMRRFKACACRTIYMDSVPSPSVASPTPMGIFYPFNIQVLLVRCTAPW